jgi:DNA-binding transcriptional MocR family regulator
MTAFTALAAPGDPVLVEAPTYSGALAAARAAGLVPTPVPSDEHGVRPDLLASALQSTGARLVVCQTAYANPHGAVLADDRREPVLDALAAAGAFLVEDDPLRPMAIDGPVHRPLLADDPRGHVVHVRSLTKVAAPGLRVAALSARGPALARLRAARQAADLFVSPVLQEAALELVTAPGWRRHLERLRTALGRRRDALLDALATALPEITFGRPAGGLQLWARLPDGLDDVAVSAAALRRGVLVNPGRHWYPFPAEAPASYLRLSFGCGDEALLRAAVARLRMAVDDVATGGSLVGAAD